MEKHDMAILTLSEDKKTLFITSISGAYQKSYETGSLLIDFLELDYQSFSMKHLMLQSIIGTNRIIDTDEFDISAEENEYNAVKKEFEEAAHICFDNNLGEYKSIEEGNISQRYSLYTLRVNPKFEQSLKINLKLATICMPLNNKPTSLKEFEANVLNSTIDDSAGFILATQPKFVDSYYFYTWADIMYFELMNVVKGNIVIKRCENCNRYFVPTGRNDAKYCNRAVPGSEKTCVEVGAIKKYEKETESNPIRKAYRTEYKKRYARVLKGKMDNSVFFDWSETMKSARDKALRGNLTYEDFMEMLKK